MIRYSYGKKLVRLSEGETVEAQVCEILLMNLEEFRNQRPFGVHKRSLAASLEHVNYCKAEVFGSCILGTVVIPNKNELPGTKLSFGFYLADSTLILVEEGSFLRKTLEQMRDVQSGGEATAGSFLILLLNGLIQGDVLFLQEYEEKLAAVEEELLDHLPENFYQSVIRYRKELLILHSYYEQLVSVGEELEEDNGHVFTTVEREAFGIFADRASRLHDHVNMLREYVLQIREMYQSQIDIRQNQIMSWLTVVTTIFLPLSILVGWYGMNFVNMPELHWKYGYLAMIIVGITSVVVEISFFKKKKML